MFPVHGLMERLRCSHGSVQTEMGGTGCSLRSCDRRIVSVLAVRQDRFPTFKAPTMGKYLTTFLSALDPVDPRVNVLTTSLQRPRTSRSVEEYRFTHRSVSCPANSD